MLFASYNIHFGLGSDNRYDLDRIADTVTAADVICLQEVVQGWKAKGFADQAAHITRRLNRYCYFHGAFDADASETGVDGRIVSRRRTFGNAVISRWPIATAAGHLLPKQSLAEGFDLQRGFVEATIVTPARSLRVYSVHLSHVSAERRLPQVANLLRTVGDAAERGPMWDNTAFDGFIFSDRAPDVPAAAIIMGDFNFRSSDPDYLAMCADLDDAWWLAGNREEVESFPGEGRIDHCFVTRPPPGPVRRAWVDTASPASDHWPLFVEIDLG